MISAGSGGRKSEKKVPTDSGAAEDLLPGSLRPHRVLGSPSSPKGSGPAGSRPHFTFVTPHSRICTQNPPRGGGVGLPRVRFGAHSVRRAHPAGEGPLGPLTPSPWDCSGIWFMGPELCSWRRNSLSGSPRFAVSRICISFCPSWQHLPEQRGPKEPPNAQAQTNPNPHPHQAAAPRPSPLCPTPTPSLTSSSCPF